MILSDCCDATISVIETTECAYYQCNLCDLPCNTHFVLSLDTGQDSKDD